MISIQEMNEFFDHKELVIIQTQTVVEKGEAKEKLVRRDFPIFGVTKRKPSKTDQRVFVLVLAVNVDDTEKFENLLDADPIGTRNRLRVTRKELTALMKDGGFSRGSCKCDFVLKESEK